MFDNLSERLERSFKILKGEGRITEINVAETLKDVRRALLDADVNYKVAKSFTDQVKAKALGQNVLTAVKPGQLLVKIVHDELAQLMGGQATDINLKGHPAVILMAGLNGAGKTTLSGKLALLLKNKRGRKPLLVACDVYRPAAVEQLRVLAEQIEVPIYMNLECKDPVQIAREGIHEAKAKGYDTVIIDTAGRLAIDEELMQEIAAIKEAAQPDETLFVVDAMTGQDAVNTSSTNASTSTAWCSRNSTATRAAVLPFLYAPWWISPLSLWARARKWKPSTCSTPSVWPTAFSAWATS